MLHKIETAESKDSVVSSDKFSDVKQFLKETDPSNIKQIEQDIPSFIDTFINQSIFCVYNEWRNNSSIGIEYS